MHEHDWRDSKRGGTRQANGHGVGDVSVNVNVKSDVDGGSSAGTREYGSTSSSSGPDWLHDARTQELAHRSAEYIVRTPATDADAEAETETETTGTSLSTDVAADGQVRKGARQQGGEETVSSVVKKRWLMLALFVLYSLTNAYQWIHLSIVSNVVLVYWNASLPSDSSSAAFTVDWLSMVYMLVYIPMIVPASYFLNRFGLRYATIFGAALNAAGAWVKCLALSPDRFAVLMTGQTLCAMSQLFVLSVPPRLAAVWFGPHEMSTATSLGVFGNQVGSALGFLIPPLLVYVNPNDTDLQNIQYGLAALLYSTAIVTSVVFILILVFMQAAPQVPPSRAQQKKVEQEENMDTYKSFKNLFGNAPFVLLAVSYGINAGCYYALSTLLQNFITAYFPGANEEAGQVGLTLVLAGVAGSVVVGIWLDRTRYFKETSVAIYILTLVCLAAFAGLLELRQIWLIFVIAFCLGLFMTGYLPVGFEFAVEITYPEPEGSSSGLLNASAQIFGIALTLSERALFESDENFGTLMANALACAILFAGVVMTALVRADLRRQRAQLAHSVSVDESGTNSAVEQPVGVLNKSYSRYPEGGEGEANPV